MLTADRADHGTIVTMAGMARDFTVLDAPRPERDGTLTIPVAGGEVIVAAKGWSLALAEVTPGTRLTARVIDSGPGWWLAKAARTG